MLDGCDMIVSLYNLPKEIELEHIRIKRALVCDKGLILSFVSKTFPGDWIYEVEHSLMQEVSKCFIATIDSEIVGFACFDGVAKGFFGPIGVSSDYQKRNVGKALLIKTLYAMRAYGYGYAILGWVNEAEYFYRKTVNAEFIKNGNPENSVYSNLTFMK